jgi:uncharacterized RDD family membrane protein YckC
MESSVPALGFAPDRAIRARAGALFLDGIILGIVTRLALSSVGDFGTALLLAVLVQFLYFFVQEAAGGQTIGKRASRLRVVQLDGRAATTGQIAIRNALRIFDALPLLYASGLVAVMWSGPGRRQRLGDKVAGTAVILQPGGKARPTGGWFLPALTVISVLLSTVIYGALYREYRTPAVGENALAAVPAPGFPGDNSQPPGVGTYTAQTNLNGTQVVGSWTFVKNCDAGICGYAMAGKLLDETDEHGQLTPATDGWHVVFPTRAFRAKCPLSGRVITVKSRASLVIHFDPGGRTAQAHETNAFQADNCAAFARSIEWNASLPTF